MSSDKAMHIRTFGRPDVTTLPTTFVQADPSNFRAIVQKLTGADDPVPSPRPNPRPPVASPSTSAAVPAASSRPEFKLHERRQRKLETIQLGRDPWENQYFSQGHPVAGAPDAPRAS
ncbi:hypothetical protein MLD38_007993 [Melastoma candidum]|nr:hypothetical protein MLD38_007993 [Melastoma candidum]